MPAYQDENGKWYRQCSTTKQVFGPVDSKEELGQWFDKDNNKDGFRSYCKEVRSQRDKIYYQENSDKVRKRVKQYRKTVAGLLKEYKHRAKKRGINFILTLEWFEEQMTKPEFNVCYFTGIEFIDESNHAFSRSLDRISSTKGYSPDNVRWVCFKLNSWKSDLTLDEVAIMFNAMAKHHNIDPFEVLKKVVDTQNI